MPAPTGQPVPTNSAEADEQEKQRILTALAQTNWNKKAAAIAINMPRRSFYRALARYNIQ
jgi:transcriptional regulator of acetoin/glycerol metabolism